jgi:hypothetical protein
VTVFLRFSKKRSKNGQKRSKRSKNGQKTVKTVKKRSKTVKNGQNGQKTVKNGCLTVLTVFDRFLASILKNVLGMKKTFSLTAVLYLHAFRCTVKRGNAKGCQGGCHGGCHG